MSRIIAGSHGGRRLQTPPGQRTRPTSDRVREALFSAVSAWAGTSGGPAEEALAGLAVLDLFAGSGAIGLEAASRGAPLVWLVESDRRAGRIAGENVRELGLGVQVRQQRAEELARTRATSTFDVVFADPPYEYPSVDLDQLVADLVANEWVAGDGLVVLERSVRTDAPRWPDDPVDAWSRDYGETVLHFWQR
ncbi:16S rRNA (guanine966-N2)-methyltransferase [Friedmanniella endophytica]|uniref:16S rRNA (Guanine966-N2)-methyltransferase n=1 Tax=Microlunatus kandeliicorticis TaxID=1759536 RepID=A0A7W3IW08_9ACTN|nr:16S rRNA (guanine(966)-N(2))-methyltransferase RsmD [Microlunatus kandeliicorticis]MBA8796296.1 16S rRNA (guanine966-N2)-methyltransferase [Microlunatus kandeliicorticis]